MSYETINLQCNFNNLFTQKRFVDKFQLLPDFIFRLIVLTLFQNSDFLATATESSELNFLIVFLLLYSLYLNKPNIISAIIKNIIRNITPKMNMPNTREANVNTPINVRIASTTIRTFCFTFIWVCVCGLNFQ